MTSDPTVRAVYEDWMLEAGRALPSPRIVLGHSGDDGYGDGSYSLGHGVDSYSYYYYAHASSACGHGHGGYSDGDGSGGGFGWLNDRNDGSSIWRRR
jgi:hypothetical protein